jgi:fructokinase
VIVNGKTITGLMHPEIGHVYPRRHALDVNFKGICPFHDDCMEGLASGTAIIARTGFPLDQLAISHPQWEIEADYLGQLCAQLVLTISPRRIVIGGGGAHDPAVTALFIGLRFNVVNQSRVTPPGRTTWRRGRVFSQAPPPLLSL